MLDAEQRITGFLERPSDSERKGKESPWVNSGIMVLDRALLARIPPGRFCDFGRDILPDWLGADVPLFGWGLPKSAYLIDMGTPEKYAQANRDWPARMRQAQVIS